MEKIVYPSKRFLRRAKAVIWSGEVLEITIYPGWRKKILLEELPDFIKDEVASNKNKSLKFVFDMFLLMSFFTVVFYAKSGSYTVGYRDGEQLVVTLTPP